jgi:hypothetical protein
MALVPLGRHPTTAQGLLVCPMVAGNAFVSMLLLVGQVCYGGLIQSCCEGEQQTLPVRMVTLCTSYTVHGRVFLIRVRLEVG